MKRLKNPAQSKILVLGTNAGQADLIKHLKQEGFHVEACAHRTGGPGEEFCDAFHLVDIINTEAVINLARDIGADLVYSISSDVAMTTAVNVSEALETPHYFNSGLIDLFNQKPMLRAFLNERNLGHVDYVCATTLADIDNWTAFPCMVKPSDSQGQRGVVRVQHPEDLQDAVSQALKASSVSGTAIIEEFLEGVEVSCNVFMRDGEIIFDVLSERLVHKGDLVGVPRGHLVPCLNVSEEEQAEAIKLVHDILASLGTQDGCLYFQMIITQQGARIIEIAPRLDGCHMWRLIKHATGEDFLATTVSGLMEMEDTALPGTHPAPKGCFELMFQQAGAGEAFRKADFPIPADALYHEYRYQDGDRIHAVNGKLEVVGYYIRQLTALDITNHRDRL